MMTSPLPFHLYPGGLRAVEIVEGLVDLVLAELLQALSKPRFERGRHDAISRMTLPALPSLITAMAWPI